MLQIKNNSYPLNQSPDPSVSAETGAAKSKIRSMKILAVRGSIWSMFGFGTSHALRLGGNLVMTRLLFPEAFGIMALVEMVMHGVQMFSDLGLVTGVIRHPRGDELSFLNTAWTLQVIRDSGSFL